MRFLLSGGDVWRGRGDVLLASLKELQYGSFSLSTHKKNWRTGSPNVCEFELTYKCGLHCSHCYTDCYNTPGHIKRELTTGQIRSILDKLHQAGVIWLCLTGGDPLTRKDFLEIYSYAKDKGFIVTIFTNACSLSAEIADHLRKSPPFAIEITLNSVNKNGYERIARAKGSFAKAMNGIRLMIRGKLPLKIKTQVTRENLGELPEIKNFVEGMGLSFRPTPILQARLDKGLNPCSLRIEPREFIALGKRLSGQDETLPVDDCLPKPERERGPAAARRRNTRLFSCAIADGDGLRIDPCGYLVPCNCIREPKIDVSRGGIKEAQAAILAWVRSRVYTTASKCRTCRKRDVCYRCPGKSLLEKGNLEAEIGWFCELARLS